MTGRHQSVLVLSLSACILVAGCSGGGSSIQPGPTGSPTPDAQRLELIKRADLDPCPESVGESSVDGLPDLTLPCLGDGPAVHLAGLRGTPTVVNIWAAWCLPCRREVPMLQRAYADLAPAVRFLGVDTVDIVNSALNFATQVQPRMRYPSVVDDDKEVLIGAGGSIGPPMTIFVDETGQIVGKSFGEYRNDEDLRADIKKYLGVAG